MKHILLVFFLWTVLACQKSSDVAPANELVGTWRLTTYCKPISSPACTTVDVPSNKGVYISFDNDGKFNEFYENTRPVEHGFLGCGGGGYKIEGNDVRIMAICMSSMSGRLIKLVSIDDKRLILSPFETSEYTFVRK